MNLGYARQLPSGAQGVFQVAVKPIPLRNPEINVHGTLFTSGYKLYQSGNLFIGPKATVFYLSV